MPKRRDTASRGALPQSVALSRCVVFVNWPSDVEALAVTSRSVLRACCEDREARRHALPRVEVAALVRLVMSSATSRGYKVTMGAVLDAIAEFRPSWTKPSSTSSSLVEILLENLRVVPFVFDRFASKPVFWRLSATALAAHFHARDAPPSRLALFYQDGRGGLPRNPLKAERMLSSAADLGDGYAQYGKALAERDELKAFGWYRRAADGGVPEARWRLGVFYEDGRAGLKPSDARAAAYYRVAADAGLASAQLSLGAFYDAGRGGLPKRPVKALRLYRLAAHQGLPAARCALGLAYEHGRLGLDKDESRALDLYTRAAKQGFAAAAVCIAFLHLHGKAGLPVDPAKAGSWLRTAADRGVVPACSPACVTRRLSSPVLV